MKGRPLKIKLKLNKKDRKFLIVLIKDRKISARLYIRSKTLLHLDNKVPLVEIEKELGIDNATVRNIRRRYIEEGISEALYDKKRSGRPKEITKQQEEKIVALACSKPPDGNSKWTSGLLAKVCIDKKVIETISEEAVRKILHRHELKPWREKNVVCH